MTRAGAEPRKQPVQGRSRATVERILEAAARIFDEHGYRGATTNRVAEEAGVSVGSLYQYFPNKDALLVALAEQHVEEIGDAFAEHLAELDRLEPSLELVLRSLLEISLALNATSRLHALLFTDCPRTPALQERLDRFTDAVVAGAAGHLARTGAGGEDPRRRAEVLVAAADAVIHSVALQRPPGPMRTAVIDDLVEVLLDGLVGAGAARPDVHAAETPGKPPRHTLSPT